MSGNKWLNIEIGQNTMEVGDRLLNLVIEKINVWADENQRKNKPHMKITERKTPHMNTNENHRKTHENT